MSLIHDIIHRKPIGIYIYIYIYIYILKHMQYVYIYIIYYIWCNYNTIFFSMEMYCNIFYNLFPHQFITFINGQYIGIIKIDISINITLSISSYFYIM